MEKFWVKALSITGPAGIVGFLISLLINNIFKEKVLEYFGSEKSFYITITIIFILGAALIISIFLYRSNKENPESKSKPTSGNNSKKAIIKRSKIVGDIVFGDKTVKQDDKSDR